MKTIELSAENIQQYLNDCVMLQKYLLAEDALIDPSTFVATASDPHGYFLGVLDKKEKLLGIGLVSKVVDPVRIVGYVNNIVVHPDARGQGLFSVIMGELEQRAKEWGCTRMELTCSREAVQGIYEKRGYIYKDTHFYYLNLA